MQRTAAPPLLHGRGSPAKAQLFKRVSPEPPLPLMQTVSPPFPDRGEKMTIDDDHMYHGAGLIQIAEHPQFTAINSLKHDGAVVANAFKVNDEIAIYLKYATKPTKAFKEYQFTFTNNHLAQ